jgi:HIV Tat-specific factor 1
MASNAQPAPSAPEFSTDPRVHFNKGTKKWAYEDEQGDEFEWDSIRNKWVPVVSLLSRSLLCCFAF